MRYLDSGDRTAANTLHAWLSRAWLDATAFRCQTGYFAADGMYVFEKELLTFLRAGHAFRLVIGGHAKATRVDDLEYLFAITDQFNNAQVAVVLPGVDGLLFHPKTFHVEKANGDATALVGSANWTHNALARNIEAGITLDTSNGDDISITTKIADSIDLWFTSRRPNALEVSADDLPRLRAWGIAVVTTREESVPPEIGPIVTVTNSRAPVPPYKSISVLRRRTRSSRTQARRRSRTATPASVTPSPGLTTFPEHAVAVVKRLVNNDLRWTESLRGTKYLSPGLSPSMLPLIRPTPGSDLTMQIAVEARYASKPDDTVSSEASTTNITHEGSAPGTRTHGNLRVNLQGVVTNGLRRLTVDLEIPMLVIDDLAVLEFVDGKPTVVRLTFVNQNDQSFASLDALAVHRVSPRRAASGSGRGGWGWVTGQELAVLPSW